MIIKYQNKETKEIMNYKEMVEQMQKVYGIGVTEPWESWTKKYKFHMEKG